MRRCTNNFTQCVFVVTRLRRWYPPDRCQRTRPRYFDARGASFHTTAPTATVFHGLAGWDDSAGAAVCDGIVAFAVVAGTVGGDTADLHLRRDLIKQVG